MVHVHACIFDLLLQFGAKPKRALLAARPFTVSAVAPKKPALPQVCTFQQATCKKLVVETGPVVGLDTVGPRHMTCAPLHLYSLPAEPLT
jgi:hypothetical protein